MSAVLVRSRSKLFTRTNGAGSADVTADEQADAYILSPIYGEDQTAPVNPNPPASPAVLVAYFGFLSSTTPSAADVAALSSQAIGIGASTLTLAQPDGDSGFPCIALPASLTAQQPFDVGDQNVQFSAPIQLVIAGASYNVFVLPFANSTDFLGVTVSCRTT